MSEDALAKYQQNNKERLQKKLVKDQSLSEKEKEKKQLYDHERYKNYHKIKKQKLVEYRKKCYKMRKNTLLQFLITIIRNHFYFF